MVDAGGTWVARAARPERHAARPAERRRWRRHSRATARAQTGAVAERQRALAHLALLRKDAVEQYLEPARHDGARAAWSTVVRTRAAEASGGGGGEGGRGAAVMASGAGW